MPDRPTVEMLWETPDPLTTLRERFGFADGAAAAEWIGHVLREHFGVRMTSCDRIVMSAANVLAWVTSESGRLIVKWSIAQDYFPRLADLAELTGWLDQHGAPVSPPVRTLDGQAQLEVDGRSIGLQRVIDGDLLDVADLAQVHEAGVVLARLHLAMSMYPDTDHLSGANTAEPVQQQITEWLGTAPNHLPPIALATLRRLIDRASSDPVPLQILHGDYRAANILCRNGKVTAVIDFEEARVDLPVTELARSAVLLGTKFHHWGPISVEARKALRAGYESVRPLSPYESSWYEPLVLWTSLAFVPVGEDPTGWRAAAQAQLDILEPLA